MLYEYSNLDMYHYCELLLIFKENKIVIVRGDINIPHKRMTKTSRETLVTLSEKLMLLTLRFNMVTQPFLKIDMPHEADQLGRKSKRHGRFLKCDNHAGQIFLKSTWNVYN